MAGSESPAPQNVPTPAALPVPLEGAMLERISIEVSGVVRLEGWARVPLESLCLRLRQGVVDLPVLGAYRLYRPDGCVESRPTERSSESPPECLARPPSELWVLTGARLVWRPANATPFLVPAYDEPLSEGDVLGRDRIYGHGPPIQEVSEDVLALA